MHPIFLPDIFSQLPSSEQPLIFLLIMLIGVVSVRAISGSPEDATLLLQQKAEKLGGSRIRILALDTPSDPRL